MQYLCTAVTIIKYKIDNHINLPLVIENVQLQSINNTIADKKKVFSGRHK